MRDYPHRLAAGITLVAITFFLAALVSAPNSASAQTTF
jgi:hypothetical protein